MIRRAPGLKLVVGALLRSLKPIGNTVLIAGIFFVVFGILGVQVNFTIFSALANTESFDKLDEFGKLLKKFIFRLFPSYSKARFTIVKPILMWIQNTNVCTYQMELGQIVLIILTIWLRYDYFAKLARSFVHRIRSGLHFDHAFVID